MSQNAAQLEAMRALYAPTPAAIAAQLPAVGANLAAALEALAGDPSHARAGSVALQLGGAVLLVRKLQEALARTASEPDAPA
jgi:hypothetical protein